MMFHVNSVRVMLIRFTPRHTASCMSVLLSGHPGCSKNWLVTQFGCTTTVLIHSVPGAGVLFVPLVADFLVITEFSC